jgi:hypothetical protein
MSRLRMLASALSRAAWLFAVQACAHAAAPAPEPAPSAAQAAPPKQPQAAPATAAKSCTSPDAGGKGLDDEALALLMSDHFLITIWARNTVIEGNVEALRKPLRAFAAFKYPAEVPHSWAGSLDRLQRAAQETAEAGTLDLAASGVAAMARVCGDCHIETSGQAELGLSPGDKSTHASDTLDKRMRRHMWALDRMWIGLTAPSDAAWNDGADALAHAPLKMKSASPQLQGDFRSALDEVRALGTSAIQAKTSEARAGVYGRALATCAYCHAFGAEVEF